MVFPFHVFIEIYPVLTAYTQHSPSMRVTWVETRVISALQCVYMRTICFLSFCSPSVLLCISTFWNKLLFVHSCRILGRDENLDYTLFQNNFCVIQCRHMWCRFIDFFLLFGGPLCNKCWYMFWILLNIFMLFWLF